MNQSVIAHKAAGNLSRDGLIDRHIRSHVVGSLSGLLGFLSLFLHCPCKTVLIHGHMPFLQKLNGQIQGKAIGIIQLKGIFSGKHGLALLRHCPFHFRQNRKTLVNGTVKLFLLLGQDLQDHHPFLLQLRITVFGKGNYRLRELCHESSFDPKKPTVAGRTAQQTAQHIAPAFIGGHNAV